MNIQDAKFSNPGHTRWAATINGKPMAGAVGDRFWRKMQAAEVTPADYVAPAVTVADVQAECARRLAAGFSYDFGGARGVHTIATTDKDMEGWREVTDIANARIATSDTTAIAIATETGTCQVTPLEWMDVLKAAAAFRQPIWSYSFALQAQDPIPTNYTDDEHWP